MITYLFTFMVIAYLFTFMVFTYMFIFMVITYLFIFMVLQICFCCFLTPSEDGVRGTRTEVPRGKNCVT